MKKVEEACREQYLSCVLLHGADQTRYSKLKDNLSNNMMKGVNNFPKILVETMRMMNDYMPMRLQWAKENNDGVAFIQDGRAPNPKSIKCWHCSKKRHFPSDCPELKVKGVDNEVQNFTFEECDDCHGLLSASKEEGIMMA